jgi:IS1 family transposase
MPKALAYSQALFCSLAGIRRFLRKNVPLVAGRFCQNPNLPLRVFCLLEISLDVETREIVGVYVGARGRDGAQGLWHALPAVYRQCAVAYTDFWSAYEEIFLSKRHQSVGKDSGKTSYIERFNCLCASECRV